MPALASQPQRQWTTRELLDISFRHPPLFQPGTEFDYSNTNTVLLGLVVEKVSGQPLHTYIDEHITRVENLDHTTLPTNTTCRPRTPAVTRKLRKASWWMRPTGMPRGDGPRDRWFRRSTTCMSGRVLATGKLLSPAGQREREQFLLAPSEGKGSLYGLELENQNGWIGHNGNITGYQAYAYYLPSRRTTMVILVNSNADALGVWHFVSGIVRIVTPDHLWPPPPSNP